MTDLSKLVRHCIWANEGWIDFIASHCADDRYLLQRMSHILLGEQAWFQRIDGRDPDPDIWNVMTVPQLRSKQADHRRAYASAMNGDLGRVIEYTRFTGEQYRSPVSDILLHLALHGTHHRGQMAVHASGTGVKPVNTDFIHFCLLNRL